MSDAADGGNFIFDIGEAVELFSGEAGEVLECRDATGQREREYLIRYVDGAGCGQERWWGESAIGPLEDDDGGGDEVVSFIPSEELREQIDTPRTLN